MPLTVAVVVCAHRLDRLPLTKRCVRSVLAGDTPPDELTVVVDNNEALRDELEKDLGPTGARILANPGNGPAAARSAAVDRTKAEVCLFIDDDAWAERTWLRNLSAVFACAGIAGAGGKVVPEWSVGARRLPPELYWIVGATYRGHPEAQVPITRPIGANMAARTEAIRGVGGFPTQFGPRGGKKVSSNEELALYTAITASYGAESVVYVPTSVVHHHVPAERTTWRYILGRCWAEGTSKADIRSAFPRGVMAYDQQYARSTLIPAIGHYATSGVHWSARSGLRDAIQCGVALGATASGYVSRLIGVV